MTANSSVHRAEYLETDPSLIRDYVEHEIGPHSRVWAALGGMLVERLGLEEYEGERQSINTWGYLTTVEFLIGDIATGIDGVYGRPIPELLTDPSTVTPAHQRSFLLGLAARACGPEFGAEVNELAAAVEAKNRPA